MKFAVGAIGTEGRFSSSARNYICFFMLVCTQYGSYQQHLSLCLNKIQNVAVDFKFDVTGRSLSIFIQTKRILLFISKPSESLFELNAELILD